MYKILIFFCVIFIILLYNIYNESIIYTHFDSSKTFIFCPKDKNNSLCKNSKNDVILYNKLKKNINENDNDNRDNNYKIYNDKNKNKINNGSNMEIINNNAKNKKTVEEILESLGKQQLYESSYKCEKIKSYNGVKYFEYMDTDPYINWDDVQKLCKKIDGYFFY